MHAHNHTNTAYNNEIYTLNKETAYGHYVKWMEKKSATIGSNFTFHHVYPRTTPIVPNITAETLLSSLQQEHKYKFH